MANTYEAIATVTVGSGGAANIEFTSIPGTYTDLQLVVSSRMSTNGGVSWYDFYIRPNNSTSNDSDRFLYGNGSSAASSTDANDIIVRTSSDLATASTFGSASIYFPNYAGSNNKSISIDNVSENNATSAFAGFTAALWADTTAISSIYLVPASGNFVQYSTATLYGIKNS